MTNAEKFKQIFGIEFYEFDVIDWENKYSKLKTYKATLSSWHFKREPLSIYITATNIKQAREKAKVGFGNEYRSFRFSDKPMYKLTVEPCADDE